MYPTSVALPYQLSEAYLSLLLHLLDELKQPSVVSLIACDDVCRAAEQVVAVLHAAHERVEFLTSISTADYDRCSPRLAYGVKELFY